ncbi:MAG: MFS transporter, partial [Pseudomonadota bacterium]
MTLRPAPCERPLAADESPSDPAECSQRRYRAIMTAAILGSSIAFIDGSIVSVALPAIREGLGASLAEMQWVINGYALMLAAFILPAGSAGDVFGRKRVFLIGVAVYTLASLWCGLARSGPELIVARIVEGVGGAFMIPASLALITVNVPKDRRGAAIGLWAAAGAASTAIGPILGGTLIDTFGWRPALLLTVPFGVATFLVAWRGVPESRAEGAHMDWTGGVLACLGLGALAYALTVAAGGLTLSVVALSVAGLVLLGIFLWQQYRATDPMMPLGLFKSRPFSGANGLTFLLYAALTGVLFLMPMTLIDAHGYSATQAGLALLPFTILVGALSRYSGGLADRMGARLPLSLGPAIVALAFASLVWVALDGGFWTAVVPAMVLLGAGMGITVAPLSTTIMNAVADEKAGTASGVNNAVSRAAGLIAVAA